MRPCAGVFVLSLVAAPALGADAPAMLAVGSLTVHAVEHATMVLTHGEIVIYVDPVGGEEAFAGHPPPDLVLVTDVHGDHLDAATIDAVADEVTPIVMPRAVADRIGERPGGAILANGETVELKGVAIEAIAAYNLTEERQKFHAKGRGNGYVLTLGDQRVYISGDTEDIPEMRALKDIDVAFVCMNLPYTMDVDAAADAVLAFAPRVVFPYHFRSQGGFSDLEEFKALVAANPQIDVRVLDWYPD
jgi:L-ascorbate metabolism protein UlaG (beta-lactamase superfamily)